MPCLVNLLLASRVRAHLLGFAFFFNTNRVNSWPVASRAERKRARQQKRTWPSIHFQVAFCSLVAVWASPRFHSCFSLFSFSLPQQTNSLYCGLIRFCVNVRTNPVKRNGRPSASRNGLACWRITKSMPNSPGKKETIIYGRFLSIFLGTHSSLLARLLLFILLWYRDAPLGWSRIFIMNGNKANGEENRTWMIRWISA